MNIYAIIAGTAVVLASYAGTFYVGKDYGENKAQARSASNEKLAIDAAEKTAHISAEAISGIKVEHTTVNQKAIHEIRTNTVYADCQHPDSMLRAVNQALTGRADSAADSKLPTTNSAAGQVVRVYNPKAPGLGLHLPGVPALNRPGGK